MPTDRALLSAITHGSRPFHNPIEPAKLSRLLDGVALAPGDRVLDVGCGPGELLVLLAERFGVAGLGVDASALQIAEARRRAAARVPGAPLEFLAGDATDALASAGTFALVACVGSSHALGGRDEALARLATLTRPGGHVLLGEGYWRRAPGARYLEAIGAAADELGTYEALARAGEAHGLRAEAIAAANQDEWDRYEWELIANGERHLAKAPGAPEAPALREWVDAARDRCLAPGGRDTLGFALLLLRRARTP